MFQYVRPARVLAALQWLKLNNPLYKHIEINNDWTSNAEQDDALWHVKAWGARYVRIRR